MRGRDLNPRPLGYEDNRPYATPRCSLNDVFGFAIFPRFGALTVVALAEGFDEHFDLRVVGRIVRGRLDSRHVQTRPAGDNGRTLQGRSDDLVHLRRVDYVPPALNAGSRHGNPIQVALHALAREGVCISSPAGHHIR